MSVVTLAREQSAAGLLQKAGFKWHLKIYGKALFWFSKGPVFQRFLVFLLWCITKLLPSRSDILTLDSNTILENNDL